MIKKVKIPKERLPVLIGTGGSVKRKIEEYTKTELTMDEEVTIDGESLDVMTTESIVKAIGRGFSPEKALELLDEKNLLIIVPLPKEKKTLIRIKSRIIGTDGLSRKRIEEMTRTFISVYGKTASIIGPYEKVEIAKSAIEKLISGASHKSVYKFLEKRLTK